MLSKEVSPQKRKYPRKSREKRHCNQRDRETETVLKMFLTAYYFLKTVLQVG